MIVDDNTWWVVVKQECKFQESLTIIKSIMDYHAPFGHGFRLMFGQKDNIQNNSFWICLHVLSQLSW